MEIKRVGVVGCGQMGGGITQVCAQAGYQVVVSEINEELLNKGLAAIKSSLEKSVAKERITGQDKDTTLSRIKGTTEMKDFSECDLVIEAAVENMDLKKKIFAQLDKICPPPTLLSSNTSALSITDMAAVTTRPDKVLGLHFFNPVPVMKLLEIVRTSNTSDETLTAGRNFGQSLGKTVIIARDVRGFIVNRLSAPFLLDAIRMLESGMATKEDIDDGVKLGLNHPMGPLALSDLVGLDTLLFVAKSIYADSKEPRHAPPALLEKMVNAGQLGRKTGQGFYDYR